MCDAYRPLRLVVNLLLLNAMWAQIDVERRRVLKRFPSSEGVAVDTSSEVRLLTKKSSEKMTKIRSKWSEMKWNAIDV